jgi:hypothetical protein
MTGERMPAKEIVWPENPIEAIERQINLVEVHPAVLRRGLTECVDDRIRAAGSFKASERVMAELPEIEKLPLPQQTGAFLNDVYGAIATGVLLDKHDIVEASIAMAKLHEEMDLWIGMHGACGACNHDHEAGQFIVDTMNESLIEEVIGTLYENLQLPFDLRRLKRAHENLAILITKSHSHRKHLKLPKAAEKELQENLPIDVYEAFEEPHFPGARTIISNVQGHTHHREAFDAQYDGTSLGRVFSYTLPTALQNAQRLASHKIMSQVGPSNSLAVDFNMYGRMIHTVGVMNALDILSNPVDIQQKMYPPKRAKA